MSTSTAARRNARVIDSGDSAEDELDALVGDDEDAEGEEDDAEGEEEDAEDEDEDAEGEDEDAEGEDDELMLGDGGVPPSSRRAKPAAPAPAAPSASLSKGTSLKLKFKVTVPQAGPSRPTPPSKPKRSAAVAQRGRYAEEDEDEEDELELQDELDDGESDDDGGGAGAGSKRKAQGEGGAGRRSKRRRASASPAGSDESFDSADFVREYDPANQAATEDVGRMTARQRAKAGLQAEEDAAGDGLLELPAELPARDVKQRGLSEMEKQRKREENARKRKLLSDQKQEEEKTDTINRLLRAQSGRTKAKIPQNLLQASRAGSGAASATPDAGSGATSEAALTPAQTGLLRFVSSIKNGEFSISVSFPEGKTDVLRIAAPEASSPLPKARTVKATCNAPGCQSERKYRCVKAFDKGGCSLEHLKLVQASLE